MRSSGNLTLTKLEDLPVNGSDIKNPRLAYYANSGYFIPSNGGEKPRCSFLDYLQDHLYRTTKSFGKSHLGFDPNKLKEQRDRFDSLLEEYNANNENSNSENSNSVEKILKANLDDNEFESAKNIFITQIISLLVISDGALSETPEEELREIARSVVYSYSQEPSYFISQIYANSFEQGRYLLTPVGTYVDETRNSKDGEIYLTVTSNGLLIRDMFDIDRVSGQPKVVGCIPNKDVVVFKQNKQDEQYGYQFFEARSDNPEFGQILRGETYDDADTFVSGHPLSPIAGYMVSLIKFSENNDSISQSALAIAYQEAIEEDEYDIWLKLAKVQAIREFFDETGKVKDNIYREFNLDDMIKASVPDQYQTLQEAKDAYGRMIVAAHFRALFNVINEFNFRYISDSDVEKIVDSVTNSATLIQDFVQMNQELEETVNTVQSNQLANAINQYLHPKSLDQDVGSEFSDDLSAPEESSQHTDTPRTPQAKGPDWKTIALVAAGAVLFTAAIGAAVALTVVTYGGAAPLLAGLGFGLAAAVSAVGGTSVVIGSGVAFAIGVSSVATLAGVSALAVGGMIGYGVKALWGAVSNAIWPAKNKQNENKNDVSRSRESSRESGDQRGPGDPSPSSSPSPSRLGTKGILEELASSASPSQQRHSAEKDDNFVENSDKGKVEDVTYRVDESAEENTTLDNDHVPSSPRSFGGSRN